jgi:hypothetical protein
VDFGTGANENFGHDIQGCTPDHLGVIASAVLTNEDPCP